MSRTDTDDPVGFQPGTKPEDAMPYWLFQRCGEGESPRLPDVEAVLVQAPDEKTATAKAIRAIRATTSGAFSIYHPLRSHATAEEATAEVRGQTAHADYVARESVEVDLSAERDDGGRR